MNIVELLWVFGLLGSGFFVSRLLGAFGVLAECAGALIGAASWVAVCKVLGFLLSRFEQSYPSRPACKQNRCMASDYEVLIVSQNKTELKCSCGDRYLSMKNRFMIMSGDSSPQPYMRRRNVFSKWKKE